MPLTINRTSDRHTSAPGLLKHLACRGTPPLLAFARNLAWMGFLRPKKTTHHSPLTIHHSPLTAHRSPLTTHHSPTHQLTTLHSPFTTHHSPLTTHHSPTHSVFKLLTGLASAVLMLWKLTVSSVMSIAPRAVAANIHQESPD